MKTKLLFTAAVLIGLTSANATKTNVAPQGEDFINTTRYRYAEPITFIERGVEFLIFPDGSFDFNTNINHASDDFDNSYYRGTSSSRGSVNGTKGAPGTISRSYYGTPRDNGVIIQHDYDGRVRRIGNVFINYDRAGKIKRLGTVYMSYDRSGTLTQVGSLRVRYSQWGEIISTQGVVNRANSNYLYGGQYTTDHASPIYNDYDDQDDYYYYRQGSTVKKQKKIKR